MNIATRHQARGHGVVHAVDAQHEYLALGKLGHGFVAAVKHRQKSGYENRVEKFHRGTDGSM